MKNAIFIFSFLLIFSSCTAQYNDPVNSGNWYTIEAFGKVPAFSKIAKEGRISVFINSTAWCAPCVRLKEELMSSTQNFQNVDFYYVQMANDYEWLKNTAGYKYWRQVERLKEWPYVYVHGPTTNLAVKYSPSSLDSGITMFDKTIEVINRIQEYTLNFDPNMMKVTIKPMTNQFETQIHPGKNNDFSMDATNEPIDIPSNTYIVKRRDTFYNIAQKFGLSVSDLLSINPQIVDPNKLKKGMEIKLPKT